MKRCPFCAEEIQDEVIICPYCKHDLPDINSKPQQPIAIKEVITESPQKQRNSTKKSTLQIAQTFVSMVLIIAVIAVWTKALNLTLPTTSSNPTLKVDNYFLSPTKSDNSNDSGYSGNAIDSTSLWFTGGTLHKSTVGEWRNATYSNRLATSADFIAATQNVDYGDLDEFKRMATDLETCVSVAVSGKNVDDEKVSFIAALCMTQLFPK